MKEMRMPAHHADGVKGAETAPVGDESRPVIGIFRERHHFLDDITLILEMPFEALFRRDVEAIEAFAVDAIHANHLDFPRGNAMAKGMDHAVVLVLEEALLARGEYQKPLAGLAKDKQLHVPLESGTAPFVILAFHGVADEGI